jgi:putative inorganic carbon (HCO3(-)) transporter
MTTTHSIVPKRQLQPRLPARRDLLALRIGDLWGFFVAQDLAFWAMCFYLVVEYIRPQQLMGPVSGWPLGQIGLALAIGGYALSGAPGAGFKGIGTWLLLLFTLVITASSFTAFSPEASFAKIRVWYSWVVIYFLIINVVNSKNRFKFYILLWLMCHYYMASKDHLTRWRKLFVLGMPVTAALGVLGSSSRGAMLGLAAIGVCVLVRNKINAKGILLVALVAGASWFVIPEEQKARFSNAGDDGTSVSRKVYWKNGLEMARTHPLLGIGYENWLVFYRLYFVDSEASVESNVRTIQVAHNIFIQCMAELGYIGLFVFILLILATVAINYNTRVLAKAGHDPPDSFVIHMSYALDEAMWAYLVSGFFVTVLYYPFFWINLAFVVALNAIVKRERLKGKARAGRMAPVRARGAIRESALAH